MDETTASAVGNLLFSRAIDHPELLGAPVLSLLSARGDGAEVGVAEIDPSAADTVAFCERYGVGPEVSANCVVVAGRREGVTTLAACVVLATTRADVNGIVRRKLGARKVSFAPMEEAIAATGMEYGGITPVGLPAAWPIFIDEAVAQRPRVVVGSGLRKSKLLLPGRFLTSLPTAEVIPQLGR